jgi:hypothetical protein
MAKLALIYKTIADQATITSTGVNSWAAERPLAYMQDTMLNRTARAVSLGTGNQNIEFLIDLGTFVSSDISTYREFDSINLINHSLSPYSKITIAIGNTSSTLTVSNIDNILSVQGKGNSLLDATGDPTLQALITSLGISYVLKEEPIYKAIAGGSNWSWSNPNWFSRRLTEIDLYGFTRVASINLPSRLSNTMREVQTAQARYIKITISDSYSASLRDFIDIGRLFVGTKFSPNRSDTLEGTSIVYTDKSILEESIGGEMFFEKRAIKREMTFSFGNLTENEVYNGVLDIQRQLGITGEILVIPDADDTALGFKKNFLGHFKSTSPIPRRAHNLFSAPITIEEIL